VIIKSAVEDKEYYIEEPLIKNCTDEKQKLLITILVNLL
jgi:hypothetical protein